jgi:methionyl-tRNA formyltransferase
MDILFAGNRAHVLKEMLRTGMRPRRIFAVKGSYLERELAVEGIAHEELPAAPAFIELLMEERFDLFLSNGCPVLLPISRLKSEDRKYFVNIHPSYLPDLRGVDPVPGALLHGRDAGATCHVMDDGIDTGGIIAQVRIPFSEDLDAGLLYQLSFIAETEAYRAAAKLNFEPQKAGGRAPETVYYTFKPEHLRIDWSEPLTTIAHRIKAFGAKSKGAWFEHEGERVLARDAEVVTNSFLVEHAPAYAEGQVVFAYERKLLVRHREGFIKLKDLDGAWETVKPGTILR